MLSHCKSSSWNLAVLLAALALCGTVTAQSVDQGDLERCSSLQTPELKLACFEALATVNKKNDDPIVSTQIGAAGSDAITADAPSAAAPAAGADPAPELPPAERVEPDHTDVADSEAIAADPPGVVLPAAAAAADAAAETPLAEAAESPPEKAATNVSQSVITADNFGSEQLGHKDSQDDEAAITAMVAEVSRGRNKILYFHFANGQIWRQIEGRRFRYPEDGEFEVIITTGMMGEYRLRLDEKSPMTRIRRVQ
jgi:hypothetical protein